MKNSFTPDALRHFRLLLRATAPLAARLERRFRAFLRERPHEPALIRALLAITPAAASRLRTVGGIRGTGGVQRPAASPS